MRYRREIWSADTHVDAPRTISSSTISSSTKLRQQQKGEEIVLHPEDWASTIAIWCNWNYVGRLNAEETCNLIVLAVDRMLRVLEAHPHLVELSQKYACAYNILAINDNSEHASRADLDITPALVLLGLSSPDRLAFSKPIMNSFTERDRDRIIERFFPARRQNLSPDSQELLLDELKLGKCVFTLGTDHQ